MSDKWFAAVVVVVVAVALLVAVLLSMGGGLGQLWGVREADKTPPRVVHRRQPPPPPIPKDVTKRTPGVGSAGEKPAHGARLMFGPDGGMAMPEGFDLAKADKEWPPTKTLLAYRRAWKTYDLGELENGFQMVQGLAGSKIAMATAGGSYNDGKKFGALFMTSRFYPTEAMLQVIERVNYRYAAELVKKGNPKTALGVLKIDLQLAETMVHATPHTVTGVVSGNMWWQESWDGIAKALRAQKKLDQAKLAEKMEKTANDFQLTRLNDEGNELSYAQMHIEDELAKLPKDKRKEYERSQMNAFIPKLLAVGDKMVKEWDKKINTPEARKFITSLPHLPTIKPKPKTEIQLLY